MVRMIEDNLQSSGLGVLALRGSLELYGKRHDVIGYVRLFLVYVKCRESQRMSRRRCK